LAGVTGHLSLHVGRSKCGSTTIQLFLDDNGPALEERGVRVVPVGWDHRQHLGIAQALRMDGRERGRATLSALRVFLEDHRDEDCVISSELLMPTRPGRTKRLAESLQTHYVTVFIYARPYPAYAVSAYNHHTKKARNRLDFDVFIEDYRHRLSMRQQVQKWGDVFGAANVRVRSLDPQALDGGNLVADLVSGLGVGDMAVEEPPRANVSWSWQEAELARAIAQRLSEEDPEFPTGRSFIREVTPYLEVLRRQTEHLGIEIDAEQYLDEEQFAMLRDVYNADVAWVNSTFPQARMTPLAEEAMRVRSGSVPTFESLPPAVRDAYREAIAADERLKTLNAAMYRAALAAAGASTPA
jgi:hypothetical protein